MNILNKIQSGRFGNSHLLQVMSPRRDPMHLEDMDVEVITTAQNRSYGGSSSDLVVELPVPVFSGQELAQRPAYEIAVAETPDKRVLKKQVSDLVEALNYEENMVHHKVHEVKVDAGTKVRQILKDQPENFQRVATEYEQ